jgi:hypothetical protein
VRRLVEDKVLAAGGRDVRGKPLRPKTAFQDILDEFRIPRSNALYGFLAKKESFEGCRSPSFLRLLDLLRAWFPPA